VIIRLLARITECCFSSCQFVSHISPTHLF
jgi:hypothetical protein